MTPMSGPTIRDAVASDAPAIAGLLGELGYPASSGEAAAHLDTFERDPASRVQVAVLDGVVVGLIATHLVPRFDAERLSCRILDLVVTGSCRRAGVGRALVRAAEADARRRGIPRLDLATGDERHDARAFYESLGYERKSLAYRKRLAES